jgi:hypothetical protein
LPYDIDEFYLMEGLNPSKIPCGAIYPEQQDILDKNKHIFFQKSHVSLLNKT